MRESVCVFVIAHFAVNWSIVSHCNRLQSETEVERESVRL